MKILGVNSSGQPVQMTNAVVTSLGNTCGWGFLPSGTGYGGIMRPIVAFPNYSDGQIQLFVHVGKYGNPNALTGAIFTSYDGLVKLPITYTSGSFTRGATVTGSISGASGTVAETYTDRFTGSPTEIYVDNVTSGPFVNGDVLSGAGVATVNSAPSTDSMGDAWKIDATIPCAYDEFGRACFGMFPMSVGGETQLVVLTRSPTNQWLACRIYDPETNTWGSTTYSNYSVDDNHGYGIAFGSSIYFQVGSSTTVAGIVDFSSGTPSWSQTASITGYRTTAYFGVYNGNLYAATNGLNSVTTVFKLVAGSWTTLGTISGSAAGSGSNRHCIFETPDGKLCVIKTASTGTMMWEITSESPFTHSSDVASSYLPSGYASKGNTTFVYPVVDRNTNGSTGTAEVLMLFHQVDNAYTISVARCNALNDWDDLGSNSNGQGHHFGMSLDGAFDVTYEPGANLGILTGAVSAVPGGQQFTYRVLGSGTVNFELLVQEDALTGGTATRGTLGSPSQGTLTDGNKKITGVSADGNEKTAIWLGASDGFSDGDFVYRLPFIST